MDDNTYYTIRNICITTVILWFFALLFLGCSFYYEGAIVQKVHHPQTIIYNFNGKTVTPTIIPERYCLVLLNENNQYEVCLSKNIWDTCKIGQYFINK